MSNERIRTYEGIFLFPQSATANLQEAADHVKSILDRCGATIVSFRKWDDRRLAYEVQGNKRGVYFLAYFTAPTSALAEIERRCNLSEELLRMMITSAEHIPAEIIEANEGQEDLATEIKLRGKKSTESGSKSASKVSHKSKTEQIKTAEPEATDEPSDAEENSPKPTKEVSTDA